MNKKQRGGRSRSEKKSKQHEAQRRSQAAGERAGGGFVDRTGKVHGLGGKRHAPGSGAAVRSAHAQPERRPNSLQKQRKEREPARAPKPLRAGIPTKLKATIDKNHKGFGFLIFEDRRFEDAFISPRDAESLFHGDRVEVTVSRDGEVTSLTVLEHRFRELVGRFTPHPMGIARGGWVVYERKRAREEIFVPEPGKDLNPNDWVRAKLHFHEKGPLAVTAEIVDSYGPHLPPTADIGMVAAEYNLIEEHTSAAVREAEQMRLEVPGKDLEGRTDLRTTPFITIDGETARDFDDAVYVERNRGGWTLWVGIADVSHYVRHGTALDREARSRGTSVYFPERAFHMLPRALSENLCSLRPNEPRLAMVAKIEFDSSGRRIGTEVMEAVIESQRRATYNEIEAEWKVNGADPAWRYAPHFELYKKIRKTRTERGSIDFDLPEAEIRCAPTGEVISISQRPRLDAHRLIEEFMIAANEAVTDWMMEREWPFVYRVHEEPAAQSLERFQQLAETVGVRFSLEAAASPKVLADVVRRLEGHPAQALLNTALLRSMKQAIYSSTHGIHYGLASEGYTHFTSPIRRYPDLVVHRLLRHAIQVESGRERMPHGPARERIEAELAEICEHCSYRERLASDAERESNRLKKVRAMVDRLGEEFDARVVGMIEPGLFAEISEPYVEGMISKESMMDDFYEFNEERMIFYGRRKRRTFRIGDPVRVRVLRADIDRRQIDLGLVEGGPQPEKEKPASRQKRPR